jgi:predicted lipoprotein with Yx(FWY)xxD motif
MRALAINAAVVLALALVGVSAAVAATISGSRAMTVTTAHTRLGSVVVDDRGHTLYLFEKDKRGHSACSGACVSYWPPLLTSAKPVAKAGLKQSLLGTIRRPDGRLQVTYAGHPLYLFFGDRRRGDTNGEGLHDFGAAWYALAPSGKKIDRD